MVTNGLKSQADTGLRLDLKQATPPGLPRWLAGFALLVAALRVNEQVVQKPISTGTSPVGLACLRTRFIIRNFQAFCGEVARECISPPG